MEINPETGVGWRSWRRPWTTHHRFTCLVCDIYNRDHKSRSLVFSPPHPHPSDDLYHRPQVHWETPTAEEARSYTHGWDFHQIGHHPGLIPYLTGYLPEVDVTGKEKWPKGEEEVWKAGMRGVDKGVSEASISIDLTDNSKNLDRCLRYYEEFC